MPPRKGQPEIFPDETEGQIALKFESRDDMIRCLDTISALEGLVCEIRPWRTIIGPEFLATLCEKNGISVRTAKVNPTGTPMSDNDRQRLSETMVRVSRNIDAALGRG